MARRAFAFCVAGMLALLASTAGASPIGAGGAVLTGGTNRTVDPTLDGGVIATCSDGTPGSLVTPFVGVDSLGAIKFTGTLRANVVRENLTNTLTFYYQIENNAGSADAIERFTNTNFPLIVATDVDWRSDAQLNIAGGSLFPGTVGARFATRSATGSTVGFTFPGPNPGPAGIPQGAVSYWHFIRTNATDCTVGSTALLNGGVATVATFSPVVPEPATLALAGIGAVALMARRRS